MHCQPCRDALSARLDGEDPGVPDALVDRHLAGCPACRAFADDALGLRRLVAVRPADPVPDLTGPILAAARQRPAARAAVPAGSHWSRWALLGVALTQLAIAAPSMLLGHDAGAPVHLAHELGAWDLALAAALLLVAFRPAHARGLVPFAATLAFALVVSAVIDVTTGRALAANEAPHLVDLAGLALLVVIARLPEGDGPLLDGLRRSRPTLAA